LIVVDTNVISYLLIPGVFSELAEKAALADEWCVPMLWRSEFRNVLTSCMRYKAMPEDEAQLLMRLAEARFWGREFAVQSSAVLSLASSSKRSAYDCEFIALAQALGLKLISTDGPVISEFPDTAIHLEDYVRSKQSK
jgi:predicted nucleic acid-binding protein